MDTLAIKRKSQTVALLILSALAEAQIQAEAAPAPPLAPQQDSKPAPGQTENKAIERKEDKGADIPYESLSVDQLLDALKQQRKDNKAKEISAAIQAKWNQSGSATVDLLIQWAAKAIKDKNQAAALDFMDQAIVLLPENAELWVKRARYHVSQNERGKAIADLREALQRDPRHFTALALLAQIFSDSGHDQQALRAWQDYLTLYPGDKLAQRNVESLSDKLAGIRS